MATLVQLLAAGVNGAANGSATFVLRGTASSAASVLWNDFEQTSQPGTNVITLDANGSAEIYTTAYTDVTLKTSAGATLRTVTVGNSATSVEVISDSFTGTSYTGSPTAASQPITLSSVLNKWNDSAGTLDWKVLVGGVAVNLTTAFGALAGLFFNVRDPAYGALGDGVTDDTTAIGLAITAATAAGGGIVFFPASTSFYKFTSLTISAANVTLMGAGPSASILKSATTSVDAITFSDSTANSFKKVVGLGLQGTGANSNQFFAIGSCPNLLFDDCNISFTAYTGDGIKTTSSGNIRNIEFKDCTISCGPSSNSCIRNVASTDNTTTFHLNSCRFVLPASFVAAVLLGPNFYVNDCIFDALAVTTGSYIVSSNSSNATAGKFLARYVGNTFKNGGATGTAFFLGSIATGTDFYEDANVFEGFAIPSALTSADAIYAISHNAQDAYSIYFGSRKGRTLEITHASTGTIVPLAFASYENVFVNYTAAGTLTIHAPLSVMVNGADCNLVIQNTNGSARDVVVSYGSAVQTYGSVAGADVTLNVLNNGRATIMMRFMHFGTGSPLAFIPSPAED